MKCKKCGVELLPTQKFCYNCGTANENRQCSICGNIMKNGYCIHCRRKQKSNYNCPQRYCIKCNKPVSGEDFLCEQCKAKKRKTTSLWMRSVAAVLMVALLSGIAVRYAGNRVPKIKDAEKTVSVIKDGGEELKDESTLVEMTEKPTEFKAKEDSTDIPAGASVKESIHSGKCGDNLTWEIIDAGKTLIISGTGEMYDFVMPGIQYINADGKTEDPPNDPPWYLYSGNVKRIVISEGVTSIGQHAFQDIYSLKTVSLSDGLKRIGLSAFDGCKNLETIHIPASTTQIGDPNIYNCIGLMPFGDCERLEGIWVDEDNPNYSSDEKGILYNKDKTKLLQYPGSLEGKLIVPEGVQALGIDRAPGLTKIIIPASVKDMEWFTSVGGLFKGLEVDENNQYYSTDEFGVLFNKNKTKLLKAPDRMPSHYSIPNTVKTIDAHAFLFASHSNLTSVGIPDSISFIDIYAFDSLKGLQNIYYNGTENQWDDIKVEIHNDPLMDVTIHFESLPPESAIQAAQTYLNEKDSVEEKTPSVWKTEPTESNETVAETGINEEVTVDAEGKSEQKMTAIIMVWILGITGILLLLINCKTQISMRLIILIAVSSITLLGIFSVLILEKSNTKQNTSTAGTVPIRMESEGTENTEPPVWTQNVLMSTNREDVHVSNYPDEVSMVASVFNTDVKRGEIKTVTFLNTLKDMPSNSWDVSEYQNGSVMAWIVPNEEMYDLYIAGEGGVNGVLGCAYLFSYYSNLEQIDFRNAFFTDAAATMQEMFYNCKKLTNLDIVGFKTDNVWNYTQMFEGCEMLQNLDVSNFSTEKAFVMGGMFANCRSLTKLDISNFDMTEVADISNMFMDCEKIECLDVSRWNTSNVQHIYGIFRGCRSLSKLDVSKWDTSNVSDMRNVFGEGFFVDGGCEQLESLDVSGWDVSKVTDMSGMFYGCKNLHNLNISNWNVSNVINFGKFFPYDTLPDGTSWLTLFVSS